MCLILPEHGQLFKDVSMGKKISIELGMNIEMVLANEDCPRYKMSKSYHRIDGIGGWGRPEEFSIAAKLIELLWITPSLLCFKLFYF